MTVYLGVHHSMKAEQNNRRAAYAGVLHAPAAIVFSLYSPVYSAIICSVCGDFGSAVPILLAGVYYLCLQ